MSAYLQSLRVNLQLLQESGRRQLISLLDKINGPKTIVIDESLIGPLGLIATPSLFSEREIKLIKFTTEIRFPRDSQHIIYLVRPQIYLMDTIINHLEKHNDTDRLFYLYFVPRKSCLCIKRLEEKNVYKHFHQVEELTWNFYPIDSDVVSMECPSVFRDVSVEGDPTSLYQAAIGLVQLQHLYGRIPKIYGKGFNAQRVWEHAKQLGTEEKLFLNGDKSAIDLLIILDRSLDIISALATQLTYEGLIDEFYGIKQNQLTIPSELFISKQNEIGSSSNIVSEAKTLFLNSNESLYGDLRDKNFNEVGKILAQNAKEISARMNASAQEKSVEDMKKLVDNLPALLAQKQSVATHTTIAEIIRKKLDAWEFSDDLAIEQEFIMCENIDKPCWYIEDLIARKADLSRVLRLMCIQCAAASGFKEKVLNYYKRELGQIYGIDVLLSVSNLEKSGLLHTQTESRPYAVLRKTLNLTVDDVVEVSPKDISYVHSFYAPLTARIIEQILKPLGWQTLKSQINNLPGPTFEDFQAQLVGIGGRQLSALTEGSLNIPRIILVFFIGGCTFAEISALRFLSSQEDNNVEFVIATTKIINKNSFLDSIMN